MICYAGSSTGQTRAEKNLSYALTLYIWLDLTLPLSCNAKASITINQTSSCMRKGVEKKQAQRQFAADQKQQKKKKGRNQRKAKEVQTTPGCHCLMLVLKPTAETEGLPCRAGLWPDYSQQSEARTVLPTNPAQASQYHVPQPSQQHADWFTTAAYRNCFSCGCCHHSAVSSVACLPKPSQSKLSMWVKNLFHPAQGHTSSTHLPSQLPRHGWPALKPPNTTPSQISTSLPSKHLSTAFPEILCLFSLHFVCNMRQYADVSQPNAACCMASAFTQLCPFSNKDL